MSACARHNLHAFGPEHARTIVFAHGFGCDQSVWRHVAPLPQSPDCTLLLIFLS
jgi:sigma-B regulation protein RsbQ